MSKLLMSLLSGVAFLGLSGQLGAKGQPVDFNREFEHQKDEAASIGPEGMVRSEAQAVETFNAGRSKTYTMPSGDHIRPDSTSGEAPSPRLTPSEIPPKKSTMPPPKK